MNRDDIIRMAREAGFSDADSHGVWITDGYWTAELERFAHLVYESVFRDANIAASRTILDAAVLEEREACAAICDTTPPYPFRPSIEAAHAIRARSNP